MSTGNTKLDANAQQALDKLPSTTEIDVLVYPTQITQAFKQFLQQQQDAGILKYNILPLAGCAIVKAPKSVILALAARNDVAQIRLNPRLSLNTINLRQPLP